MFETLVKYTRRNRQLSSRQLEIPLPKFKDAWAEDINPREVKGQKRSRQVGPRTSKRGGRARQGGWGRESRANGRKPEKAGFHDVRKGECF